MAGTQGPVELRTTSEHHDGAVDREKHRAAAQLRVDAHAARPAVPGRRRGPYRAADWSQGAQSRSVGRALPEPGADRTLREARRQPDSQLWRHRTGARVEGRAFLLVDDHAPPQAAPEDQLRSTDAACRTRLSRIVPCRTDRARRKLCGPAILTAHALCSRRKTRE